jgi:hypothetical protein
MLSDAWPNLPLALNSSRGFLFQLSGSLSVDDLVDSLCVRKGDSWIKAYRRGLTRQLAN